MVLDELKVHEGLFPKLLLGKLTFLSKLQLGEMILLISIGYII
jgi:hypothetical protein